MKKGLKFGGLLALGLALLIMLIISCAPEEAVPRSYSCAVYTEQGCAKFVVASGGEIEIQSGGTFDLQSGATVDFSGGVDLDGSTLTMDADGDTTMVASSDDIITTTISDTAGYLVVHIGNLKVGNGSPTTSQDGEDAYVEGGFEVDGTIRLDGALEANSTVDIDGNISSSDAAITMTDNVMIDGAADQIQLLVQGASQGSDLIVAETSGGTDLFNVGISGDITYSVSYADAASDDTNVIEAYSSQQTDIWRIQDDGGSETYVVVTATGEMSWRSPVISCADLSYQLTVSDSAALVSNQGVDGAGHGNGATQTFDLPAAKAGRHFCFINWTTTDGGPTMAINPQDSDQVAFLTNANGDCISNTTNGDAICLVAQDDVFWLATSETGTWADGN